MTLQTQEQKTQPKQPQNFLLHRKIGEKLGYREETVEKAIQYTEDTSRLQIGKSEDVKAGAALYLAGKRNDQARPRKRIAQAIQTVRDQGYVVDSTSIKKESRLRGDIKGMIESIRDELDLGFEICLAPEYIEMYRKRMNDYEKDLDFESAKELLEKLNYSKMLAGKSQVALAGSAIYIVNEDKLTQKEVAKLALSSRHTIKNSKQDIRKVVENEGIEVSCFEGDLQ